MSLFDLASGSYLPHDLPIPLLLFWNAPDVSHPLLIFPSLLSFSFSRDWDLESWDWEVLWSAVSSPLSLVVYFLVLIGPTIHKYAQSFMCSKYLSQMALLSNLILTKSNYNQAITLIVNSRLAMLKIGRLLQPQDNKSFRTISLFNAALFVLA